MLCIFPFEADLYNKSGLRTIFVGHPMIERLGAKKIDAERDSNLIGLFPGSRSREVRKIFPILIESGRELRQAKPDLRFEIAAVSDDLAREMDLMLDSRDRDPFSIKVGQAAEIMQRAFTGIVASGSATLEAAYFGMPFVLIYKVSWITYLAGRVVVKVKYLGMPNVLADREIVPEFIQHRAKPASIAHAVSRLFEKDTRAQMFSDFDKVRVQLGGIGASERAAKALLAEIS
jgi:lipid-A-disaccharide synthase